MKSICRRTFSLVLALCLVCGLMGATETALTARANIFDDAVTLIPMPTDYFGEADAWEYEDDDGYIEFDFPAATYPKDKIDAYVKVLTREYGLDKTLSKKNGNGDQYTQLDLDKQECVYLFWDKSDKELTVQCSDKTVLLSDTNPTEYILYYPLDEYPKKDVDQLVTGMTTKGGFKKGAISDKSNGDRLTTLTQNGSKAFRLYWYDDANVMAVSYYQTGLLSMMGFEDLDDQMKAAGKAPKVTTSSGSATSAPSSKKDTAKKVDPNNKDLPDLSKFLGSKYTQDQWGITHLMTCVYKKDAGKTAVKEYVKLLQDPRFQLKLKDSWDYKDGSHSCTDYIFSYTGTNSDIYEIIHKAGYSYHVKVTFINYSGQDQVAIILYVSPEFDMIDDGDRYSGKSSSSGSSSSSSSSGSSSSGSSSSTSSSSSSWRPSSSSSNTKPAPVRCTKCGGDGKVTCSRCNGNGGKYNYSSVANYSGSTSGSKTAKTWENCSKCRGSGTVDCGTCGGDGKK